jgi:hypothetical protein
VFDSLNICSPKRNSWAESGWEGFFPYYAGYPETFARTLLISARLRASAVVLDPWNGSGTTTYTASLLGLTSCGFDLNPVMIIVARARLLPPSEADSIEPLAKEIVRFAQQGKEPIDDEPLSWWFADNTSASIRAIERSLRRQLVGEMTVTPTGTNLDRISGLAATFYVALFSVCRKLTSRFLASNPTWLRRPKAHEPKVDVPREVIEESLFANLRGMAQALANRRGHPSGEQGMGDLRMVDTTRVELQPNSVDLIITSPPYCTRIDYTAATRIELAVMAPLSLTAPEDLSRKMIGTTRVPLHEIAISPTWGQQCSRFLEALRKHPSKASSGYYYKTHLDYFDKIARSMTILARASKTGGGAIFVVQDSYYKEIHNDLPSVITEIAEAHGLRSERRDDFRINRSMSGINPHTRLYKRPSGSVEAVLYFTKL